MSTQEEILINVLLDNINKIVDSTIMCFTDPHYILGKKDIVLSLLSVDDKIKLIKKILKEGI